MPGTAALSEMCSISFQDTWAVNGMSATSREKAFQISEETVLHYFQLNNCRLMVFFPLTVEEMSQHRCCCKPYQHHSGLVDDNARSRDHFPASNCLLVICLEL